MAKINFMIPWTKGSTPVEGRANESVLQAAQRAGVPIKSSCGGNASCGLCHIHVKSGGAALAPQSQSEKGVLQYERKLTPESRLACQVKCQSDLTVEVINVDSSKKAA